jgi:hypothetical protein
MTSSKNQLRKGPFHFSPFTSVSAVSRGHPSLVSLVGPRVTLLSKQFPVSPLSSSENWRPIHTVECRGELFNQIIGMIFYTKKCLHVGDLGGLKFRVRNPRGDSTYYRRVVNPDFVKEIWVSPISSSATSTSSYCNQ